MFLGLPHSLAKILVAGDVVAIKDGPRGNHSIKLRTFEEPPAYIVFREPTNVRRCDDFSTLDTKFEACPSDCVS